MNEISFTHPALLPAGLRDVLPPEAELKARLVETIMDCFAAHGYERVDPPLLEFEDSLFANSGAATSEQTFRMMDPESQRMMGVRADTTPQIARLAITRLTHAARPLRLTYAGQCLRVRGSQLQPERQFTQAGIELIGNDTAEADAEIILTAVEAVAKVGLNQLSVDLTVPRLIPAILEFFTDETRHQLEKALDRKDVAAVATLAGAHASTLQALLAASGSAATALPALLAIDLPDNARSQALRVAETVSAIARHRPDLPLTIDPVEFRGYRYHTGLCMTLYSPGHQVELGRGGRYEAGDTEAATGITLYPDVISRVVAPSALRSRLYLPYGTLSEQAAALREQNFATIAGLAPEGSAREEAARLGCTHVLLGGVVTALF